MTTDVLPILATGQLDTIFRAVQAGPIRDWPAEAIQLVIAQCRQAVSAIQIARRSYDALLRQGTDANSFVAQTEPFLRTLRSVPAESSKVLEQFKGQVLEPPLRELWSAFVAMTLEAADLIGFLETAIATANLPSKPIDWERVRQAEEAYMRGETKPFPAEAPASNGK